MKRTLEEQLGGTRARLRRRRSTIERALAHTLKPGPGVAGEPMITRKRCFVELVYREVLICTTKSGRNWPDVPHDALLRLRNGYTWAKVDELMDAADVTARLLGNHTDIALALLLGEPSP